MIMGEKIYYHEGDVVRVRQDIHKPEMIVKGIKKSLMRTAKPKPRLGNSTEPIKEVKSTGTLQGVECFWFTMPTGEYQSALEANEPGQVCEPYQSALFNTKDLEYVPGKNPNKD